MYISFMNAVFVPHDHGAIRAAVLILSFSTIGLLIRVFLKKRRQPLFLTTTRLSVMDKEVQKTCRYIEKNFADPGLCIDSICKDLVTGAAFLEALFEKELGLGVSEFIGHVRLNRARILIEKDPSTSLEAVATETGFASAEVFSTCFKTATGTSFKEYCAIRALKASGDA
jgi:transcriptional regulator GlxA family with amidase domain